MVQVISHQADARWAQCILGYITLSKIETTIFAYILNLKFVSCIFEMYNVQRNLQISKTCHDPVVYTYSKLAFERFILPKTGNEEGHSEAQMTVRDSAFL